MLLFVAIASPLTASPKSPPLVLAHVTIIDATGAAPRPDMAVVIDGNRIVSITPSAKLRVPRGARVIDAAGKFLIPGLWDMHVHLFSHTPPRSNADRWFPLFIANGVTGVRDMFTNFDDFERLRQLRAGVEDGTIAGPRVAAAGLMVDGVPVEWPGAIPIANAGDARKVVREAKQRGLDFIKVYDSLSRDSYFAIAAAAKKERIAFAGHVPGAITAAEASKAGQKSIEHLTRVLMGCSSREAELDGIVQNARTALRDPATREAAGKQLATILPAILDSFSESRANALFATFREQHTWHVPTLVHLRSKYDPDNARITVDMPNLQYVAANEREAWKSDRNVVRRPRAQELYARMAGVAGMMSKAHVGILAGTDVGNPYLVPGFSLHDELAIFVEQGMTPLQALQTATRNPARFLGLSDSLGTVEAGKLADLVLLDADPLADIHNTQRIAAVIANGRYFSKETLQKMLDGVAAAVR
ncbi:MAG: hypothetical protein JWO97_538 [Acidobacteria bacterium]|nr:hypothetical protein [Acidobacteriota bacterium]